MADERETMDPSLSETIDNDCTKKEEKINDGTCNVGSLTDWRSFGAFSAFIVALFAEKQSRMKGEGVNALFYEGCCAGFICGRIDSPAGTDALAGECLKQEE